MDLRRRAAALLAVALVGLAAAGCGNKEDRKTEGKTEAAYIDVAALKYQVQISRQLNPADPEDRAYLQAVPAAERALRPDESWFAVFMRVENESKRPQPAAVDFTIQDTQDNTYTPVPLQPTNPFAYTGGSVPSQGFIPIPDSPAFNTPSINGLLVLFKVRNLSYDNRPLVLTIKSPKVPQQEGTVDLDV